MNKIKCPQNVYYLFRKKTKGKKKKGRKSNKQILRRHTDTIHCTDAVGQRQWLIMDNIVFI